MAPRRKHREAPSQGREFKLRIPQDVAERIEAEAKDGRPMNRVIINDLADIPELRRYRDLANLVEEMKIVLAKQGARIKWQDLSDDLLNAVDAVLKTEGTAQQAAIDKLRVERSAMLRTKASKPEK